MRIVALRSKLGPAYLTAKSANQLKESCVNKRNFTKTQVLTGNTKTSQQRSEVLIFSVLYYDPETPGNCRILVSCTHACHKKTQRAGELVWVEMGGRDDS